MGERLMPDGAQFSAPRVKRDLPPLMKDRLIVALDVLTVQEAKNIVAELDGVVSFFKIGFRLYITEGVDELYSLTTSGGRKLFLDAKMFDVSETIHYAIKSVV